MVTARNQSYSLILKWLSEELYEHIATTGDITLMLDLRNDVHIDYWEDVVNSLLYTAFHFHRLDVANAVLSTFGMTLDSPGTEGALGVEIAFGGADIPTIKLLISQGADVNWYGPNNTTPLMYAVGSGNLIVAQLLLEHGADVNRSTIIDDDETPLMVAASMGSMDMCKLLVKRGANLLRRNRNGLAAEDLARQHGYVDIANWLSRPTKR